MALIYEIMIGASAGLIVGITAGYMIVARNTKDSRLEKLSLLQETRKPILRNAVTKTTCANALLLKIHNGGGKLIEGQNWYSSVIDEAPERDIVSAKENWQNVEVDEEYKILIRKLRINKKLFIKTDDMRESFLKRNYIRMGIIGSIIMEVFTNEYAYYYVSYPVRHDLHQLSDSSEFNILELSTIALQKKYRKFNSFEVLELE